ncbi:Tyrosine recombinase XerD [subsurface metagenome]
MTDRQKFGMIKWTGGDSRLPAYLYPQEAHRIIEATAGSRQADRDRLLLELLLQTGLRISEALAITPADLGTLDRQPICRIRKGKGGKERIVALPAGLSSELLIYCRQLSFEGEDRRIFRITRQRAWQIVKDAAGRAGVSKNVYLHLFRHSYAIGFLRETGHPQALMTLLGHSTPAMTLRYLKLLQTEDALKIAEGFEL